MTLDELARLGTAISGLTTAFGFVLAWRGFNGWRHQKRAEHQADAARKAYSALARACDALEKYAQRPYIPGPGLQEYRDRSAAIRKLMDERRRELEPVLMELSAAEESAALYLGAPYDLLFSWAKAVEGIVRKSAARWTLHVSDGEEEEAADAFEEAFGARTQKSISELRSQMKHALRPVARYHGSPLFRWVLFSRLDSIIKRIDRSGVPTAADASESQPAPRSTAA
ncbi:hypothetical protein [Anaeromyxobacter sp. PSR-1]|uniref:hypothetical protein n=1 Tax=Anaeromyxobacter sp. PSR-1 TaxID=1300915 RepID=UPI0005DEF3A8|nr:hypothetical protein [Anaeromyxobacter sp. PSR-1]GAO01311.1 hypothetical protein PSR1_00164 [Anaeromyxobacter sp. PSR-1]